MTSKKKIGRPLVGEPEREILIPVTFKADQEILAALDLLTVETRSMGTIPSRSQAIRKAILEAACRIQVVPEDEKE